MRNARLAGASTAITRTNRLAVAPTTRPGIYRRLVRAHGPCLDYARAHSWFLIHVLVASETAPEAELCVPWLVGSCHSSAVLAVSSGTAWTHMIDDSDFFDRPQECQREIRRSKA